MEVGQKIDQREFIKTRFGQINFLISLDNDILKSHP